MKCKNWPHHQLKNIPKTHPYLHKHIQLIQSPKACRKGDKETLVFPDVLYNKFAAASKHGLPVWGKDLLEKEFVFSKNTTCAFKKKHNFLLFLSEVKQINHINFPLIMPSALPLLWLLYFIRDGYIQVLESLLNIQSYAFCKLN